jgi:hypothetical protein
LNINSTLTNYVITSTAGFKSTDIAMPNMQVMYSTVVDNILSEMNKRFNDLSDFLTAISVFNPTLNNLLNNYFVLKFTNYYDDDKYFSDKVLSQFKFNVK